jgi:tRNA-dihydrouridine synthase C
MEGVFDAPMRALIAEAGGFDYAVSEFIRVSNQKIKASAIAKAIPELAGKRLGRAAALPVQVQLLGADPILLAETAIEACSAGARAIDFNFGCPSPTVIRRNGGSALLQNPSLIARILSETRKMLPAVVPVSAKIRLGWASPGEVFEIAQAVRDGGASWLTVHARTKKELYRPGVHWEPLLRLNEDLGIPVIANGDLFTLDDLEKCLAATACRHFMLGRGVLLDPFLGQIFSASLGIQRHPGILGAPEQDGTVSDLALAMRRFIELAEVYARNNGYVLSRAKQWLGLIRIIRPEHVPRALMTAIGKSRNIHDLMTILDRERTRQAE